MKLNKLRQNDGCKLTLKMAQEYAQLLESELLKAGFITYVSTLTHTSMDISNNGCQFNIDPEVHGYNARITENGNCVGWKRTTTPTWDQRVEFNSTVNAFFDKHNLKCNIRSGPFTVRDYDTGGQNESRWEYEIPEYLLHNQANGHGIIEPLTEDMKAQAKELRRKHRNQMAKLRRLKQKNELIKQNRDNLKLVVNR